jgi:aspartate carbamoyltransferase catalytic subunit
MTLNAMHPDLLVVRHPHSGAVDLLAQKVNCAVLNAGDGRHEHPTQALLDALTIRREKGRLHRLTIAICGDIAHSRVARSNIHLLGKMENRLRLIGPPTLMPSAAADWGVEVYDDMAEGLADADVVMMLRLQKERMDGAFIPSEREYYHRFGLDAEKLKAAKPDAIVMHPGPMNRGVEIDGTLADDINRSVIQEQVEMGVAVRMAAMDLLAQNLRAAREARARGSDGMTPTTLHIFAINGESDLRHTNLTRAQGLSPDLPALEEWLGVDTLLTDLIEVFPIEDLGDMSFRTTS